MADIDFAQIIQTINDTSWNQNGDVFSANSFEQPNIDLQNALTSIGIFFETMVLSLDNTEVHTLTVEDPKSIAKLEGIQNGSITPSVLEMEAVMPELDPNPLRAENQQTIDTINRADWNRNGDSYVVTNFNNADVTLQNALDKAQIDYNPRSDNIGGTTIYSVTVSEPEAINKLEKIKDGSITADNLEEFSPAEPETKEHTWQQTISPSELGGHNSANGNLGSTVALGDRGQLSNTHAATLTASAQAALVAPQPEPAQPEPNVKLLQEQNWKMNGGEMTLASSRPLTEVQQELRNAGIEFEPKSVHFGSTSAYTLEIGGENIEKLNDLIGGDQNAPAVQASGLQM